jgi:hypothetical protein
VIQFKDLKERKVFLELQYFLAAEPPKGSQHCPRKNGYFAHPDPSICHLFYNCIDGEYTEVPCTPGLHFEEYQGTCVWPESSGRAGCNKAESECRNTWPKNSSSWHLVPSSINDPWVTVTEHCDGVVSTPTSYSDKPSFKFRHESRLNWLRFSCVSSDNRSKRWDNTVKYPLENVLHGISNSPFTNKLSII